MQSLRRPHMSREGITKPLGEEAPRPVQHAVERALQKVAWARTSVASERADMVGRAGCVCAW